MSNGFAPSAGQQAGLPIQYGSTNLALVGGSQPSNILSSAPTNGPIIPIASQRPSITLTPFGTIADDLVIYLLAQINGSSYFPLMNPRTGLPWQWTGAQIKQAFGGSGTGLCEYLDVKANAIKPGMAIGSTSASASNGVTMRVMD